MQGELSFENRLKGKSFIDLRLPRIVHNKKANSRGRNFQKIYFDLFLLLSISGHNEEFLLFMPNIKPFG
jgi:hypothetical protein